MQLHAQSVELGAHKAGLQIGGAHLAGAKPEVVLEPAYDSEDEPVDDQPHVGFRGDHVPDLGRECTAIGVGSDDQPEQRHVDD